VKEIFRTIEGIWWLPEKPEERWVGLLRIEEGIAPTLSLTIPKDRLFVTLETRARPNAIFGYEASGTPFSLFHPSQIQMHSANALTKVTYSIGHVARGLEIADQNEVKTSNLVLRLQYLYEWAGQTGFIPNRETGSDLVIRHRLPEKMTFRIDDDLEIQITHSCGLSHSFQHREISEDTEIRFISKNGLSLAERRHLRSAVRGLLHFASLRKVYPIEERGTLLPQNDTSPGDTNCISVDFYSSLLRRPIEEHISDHEWIFRLSDLQHEFGHFFANWSSLLDRYEEALSSYFSTIYHALPPVLAHLSLTQALEGFHGVKFQSHKTQDFQEKIKSLTGMFTPFLGGLIPSITDFADVVRDNRNFYTHHNPKWLTANRVVRDSDLFRLNEKLKLVFQMCVLTELGIPADRFSRLRLQLADAVIDYY
jgi:hypothetical protein